MMGTGTQSRDDQQGQATQRPFLADIQEIQKRAREHIEQGAVTSGYKADRDTVLKVLNDVLATEIICTLRYKRHYFMATGINSDAVAAEFKEHAQDEQQHTDWVAYRIVQLDGEPNFSPEGLQTRSHVAYMEGTTLNDMIRENLIAERVAIDTYRAFINYLQGDDPTTRRIMEKILEMEEEHAEDMADLLTRT
jgi:bacterioferritin